MDNLSPLGRSDSHVSDSSDSSQSNKPLLVQHTVTKLDEKNLSSGNDRYKKIAKTVALVALGLIAFAGIASILVVSPISLPITVGVLIGVIAITALVTNYVAHRIWNPSTPLQVPKANVQSNMSVHFQTLRRLPPEEFVKGDYKKYMKDFEDPKKVETITKETEMDFLRSTVFSTYIVNGKTIRDRIPGPLASENETPETMAEKGRKIVGELEKALEGQLPKGFNILEMLYATSLACVSDVYNTFMKENDKAYLCSYAQDNFDQAERIVNFQSNNDNKIEILVKTKFMLASLDQDGGSHNQGTAYAVVKFVYVKDPSTQEITTSYEYRMEYPKANIEYPKANIQANDQKSKQEYIQEISNYFQALRKSPPEEFIKGNYTKYCEELKKNGENVIIQDFARTSTFSTYIFRDDTKGTNKDEYIQDPVDIVHVLKDKKKESVNRELTNEEEGKIETDLVGAGKFFKEELVKKLQEKLPTEGFDISEMLDATHMSCVFDEQSAFLSKHQDLNSPIRSMLVGTPPYRNVIFKKNHPNEIEVQVKTEFNIEIWDNEASENNRKAGNAYIITKFVYVKDPNTQEIIATYEHRMEYPEQNEISG